MSLDKSHIALKDGNGNVSCYLDADYIPHSVESIRDAVESGDDSFGAVSWFQNMADADVVSIWGIEDSAMPVSTDMTEQELAHAIAKEKSRQEKKRAESAIHEDEMDFPSMAIAVGFPEIEEREIVEADQDSESGEPDREIIEKRERKFARARKRKLKLVDFADNVSYYGYFASWIFFGIFILGRFIASVPLISFVGVIGSLISVSSSLIASEFLGRVDGSYKLFRALTIGAGAVGLGVLGLYGLFTGDSELSSAGVIGLLVWSFIPSVIDMAKQHRSDFDYREYEYDDDGNIINADDYKEQDATASYGYYYSSSSTGNAFSAINEVFGIPQPVDPPPIEVSRDDMYDDDWNRIIDGVEIKRDEEGNIVLSTIADDGDTSKNYEENEYDAAIDIKNDDTLIR